MKTQFRLLPTLAFAVLLPGISSAALTLQPDNVTAQVGDPSVAIPVRISGGDPITDMAGIVQILGGPQITGTDYAGSVWQNAPGGFFDFNTVILPAALSGPNVVLQQPGESVSGDGLLFTLVVDTTGLGPGTHTVRLSGTPEGDTELLNANVSFNPLPLTFLTGTLTLTDDPLLAWRTDNFGSDANDPALEATVWGDNADPDLDLLCNMVEFFLGTDPNLFTTQQSSPTQVGRPVPFIQTAGSNDYFALAYTRRINRGTVTGNAASSADLITFNTNNLLGTPAPVTLPGGEFEYVVERYNIAFGPGNLWRFFRLAITP